MPDQTPEPALRKPSAALAWSEARIDDPETPGPAIALWLPEGVTVAIGIGQKPEAELEIDAMRRDGVGLVRRQSGGGAVLLYPGTLCWEAWADAGAIGRLTGEGAGIRPAYAALSLPVVRALKTMGIEAFHAGICDLSAQAEGWPLPKKLAGTAQLRRRDRVLVHGSLLVAPDLDVLSRYLLFPGEQPDYRQGRAHREFCASVAEMLERNGGDADALIGEAAGAIAAEAEALGWETCAPPAELDAAAAALERGKYCSDAWNWEKIRDGRR